MIRETGTREATESKEEVEKSSLDQPGVADAVVVVGDDDDDDNLTLRWRYVPAIKEVRRLSKRRQGGIIFWSFGRWNEYLSDSRNSTILVVFGEEVDEQASTARSGIKNMSETLVSLK